MYIAPWEQEGLLRHGQIKITFLIVLVVNLEVMLIKQC
jgi:hypothetical protein